MSVVAFNFGGIRVPRPIAIALAAILVIALGLSWAFDHFDPEVKAAAKAFVLRQLGPTDGKPSPERAQPITPIGPVETPEATAERTLAQARLLAADAERKLAEARSIAAAREGDGADASRPRRVADAAPRDDDTSGCAGPSTGRHVYWIVPAQPSPCGGGGR